MSIKDNCKLKCVGTIGDLKAISIPGGLQVIQGCVIVLGYYEPGDGAGGLFVWDPASIQDFKVDGITVKPASVVGPGRWKRVFSGPIL
jgi:hypothetical protein